MRKKLKVKLIHTPRLEQKAGSDWIDLRAAKTVDMVTGEYAEIPLGVCIRLPRGYEAIVAPRSSTFRKYGVLIANGIGIIDETYCGDGDMWHFLAYATRDTTIHKDERICQFRIVKHQPRVRFRFVDKMTDPDRGGIGSTGRI